MPLPDDIDDVDRLMLDFVAWVVESRGRGVTWLDDTQRAAIDAALDMDAPGADRLRALLDVIEEMVDKRAVREFMAARQTQATNNPRQGDTT